jgi:hypothetical protein
VFVFAGAAAVDLLGMNANSISAFASTAAAVAAFLAARESSQAARDSNRALSYATKPDIRAQLLEGNLREGHGILMVRNHGNHEARDVRISWQLRDGSKGAHLFPVLSPKPEPGGVTDGSFITVDAERVDIGEVDISDRTGGTDTLIIEFGTALGQLRWRRIVTTEHTAQAEGGISSHTYEQHTSQDVEVG